ncbi:MAG: DUF7948 domain-containing protein [Bacteroidia bacterium]
MKKIYLIATLAFTVNVFSQGRQMGSNWSSAWQTSKVFIENKGQFTLPASSEMKLPNSPQANTQVSYAYDGGSTRVFFTPKGVVYSFAEKEKKEVEAKDEAEREREEKVASYKTDAVSMEWVGANENVEIVSENQTTNYFSYAFNDENGTVQNVNYINGYKKLTYKNLYPNIDVEYAFHPTDGIKYAIILHPGADVSQLKMKYNRPLTLNDGGDMHIASKFGDIVEHTPKTFYADNESSVISSRYFVVGSLSNSDGRTMSFQLDGFDATQTVIIDPWVQTPTIANSNCVWECEKDGAGNVYIIGGDSPMKLLKYNATGTLQWTYTTPWDTANDWLGGFATDLAGNSYVTNGSVAALQKINTSGGLVYSVTGGSMDEYWNIAFNCDQTKLIIGGTHLTGLPGITGSGVIFDINTANGSVFSMKTVGYTTPAPITGVFPDEVRSISSSYNARYYYLTLDSMGAIDQNFSACSTSSAAIFGINSGYHFGYKCENYRPVSSNGGNSGIMAIRANRYFVYTHNGTTISKRSLITGAIINTVTIAGGISTSSMGFNQVGNSGIDIDSCGNVYVGSGNSVIKYDANLNLLSTVSLPFAVYDVSVSYGGNVIVAGSTGTSSSTTRTGYVQSINMSACNPMTLFCCDATVCQAGPFCTTSPSTTLTPVTPGGTWSGTGVNASGVFDPATAGAGTHTIVYTLTCGSDSINITVVNTCATLTVCQSNNNITVSGGTPSYTWQSTTTYTDCSGCFGGICTPPLCNGVVSTSLTPIASGTNTIAAPGSNSYPVIVTDNASNSYTITSLASVPTCTSSCATPTLVVNSATVCAGNTATLTASGATTYSWNTGATTAAISVTPTVTTTYTVTGTTGTCTATHTTSVVVNSLPTVTINSATICAGSTATLTASGATTYSWNTGATTAAISVTPTVTTTYTVTGTDNNGCTNTATSTVTVNASPNVVISSSAGPTPICAGDTTTLTASGATTYTWSANASSATTPTIVVSPTVTTTYTVIGTSSGCSLSATTTVTVNALPSVTVNSATICAGSTATLTAHGASTYSWNTGATTATITPSPTVTTTYTVIGSNGCASTATTTVTVNTSPTITVNSATVCAGSTATLTASGATTYSWNTGATTAIITPSPTVTTSYTVIGTDSNGCVGVATANIIVSSGSISVSATKPTVCWGVADTLNATGVSTYTWTASNGVPISSNGSQVIVTQTANVTYTVTGSLGGSCATSSATIMITVAPQVTVAINASPSATICSGSTATLTASGATTYSWSTNAATAAISVTPTITTTYTVTGTDINTCTNTATSTVTVNTLPPVTVNSATLCVGSTATLTASGASTYSWNTGATTSTISPSPTVTTTYTVTGTDINTCTNTATSTVMVNVLPIITVNSATICAGSTTTLTASGASTYSWNTGATTSTISPSPTITTTYTVNGTDINNCKDSNTVIVTVHQTPIAQPVRDTVICKGSSVTLTETNNLYTYYWTGPAPSTGTVSTNTSVIITQGGIYTLHTTNSCGNIPTTFTITTDSVKAGFTASPLTGVVPVSVSFTNTSTGNSLTYTWHFGDGDTSTLINPTENYTSAGTFQAILIATDNLGCKDTTSINIIITEAPTLVIIPNIFSPNGDGVNDIFSITATGITNFNCAVYDRWGLLLYEWTGLGGGWNGKAKNGTNCTDGTYFYILNYDDNTAKTTTKHGFFELIR